MATQTNIRSNAAIISEMYAAFIRGDIPAILLPLSPTVHWVNHMDPMIPWSGDQSGSRVMEFFNALSNSVDVLGFEPVESVSEGEYVVFRGTFSCRSKATGKSATTQWVHLWRVKDGQVLSFDQYSGPELSDIFRP